MLNKLQQKQMDALQMRLENPEMLDPSIHTKGDLSLALFNAYISAVDKLKFVNNAIIGLRKDKNDEYDDANLTPVDDAETFYQENRLNIIKYFEKDDDGISSIIAISDLINTQQDDGYDGEYSDYQEVTPHSIGLIVYGNDKTHAQYYLVCRELVTWITAKSADLFYDVARSLPNEPLIEPDYRIDEFLEQQHDSKLGMGWAQTKYILDTLNAKEFAEIALLYPKMDNKNRTDGKCQRLKYMEDPLHFYDFNRLDTLSWLNDYINNGPEINGLKTGDLIVSLQLWLKNIGLMPISGISINEMTDIIYANNKANLYYDIVINAIAILIVEALTVNYQEFDRRDTP